MAAKTTTIQGGAFQIIRSPTQATARPKSAGRRIAFVQTGE